MPSFAEVDEKTRTRTYADGFDRTSVIDSFRGANRFLSNFYDVPYTVDGITYLTNEHYFAAAKTDDHEVKAWIVSAPDGKTARTRGQKRSFTLVDNWDKVERYAAMQRGLEHKFAPGTRERELLLATGDALLIEDTTGWHDQVWGDCRCAQHIGTAGANRLGRALMDLRSQIRGDKPKLWPRAMVTGHRPQDFDAETAAWVQDALRRVMARLVRHHGTHVAISGLALGVDTWWAQAALGSGLELWGYVPFEDQAVRWSREQQSMWRDLREACTRQTVLGEGYNVGLLHARNYYMVRDSSVVVAVLRSDKTSGGTFNAVKKARSASWPIILIDPVKRTITTENVPPGRSS